jgi:hypothetical protein
MSNSKLEPIGYLNFGLDLTGKCPDEPCLVGGVKGHNVNDISLPGSVALWAESFKFELWHLTLLGSTI